MQSPYLKNFKRATFPLIRFIPVFLLAIPCIFPVNVYIQQLDITISSLWFSFFAGITNFIFAVTAPFEKLGLTYAQALIVQLIPLEIVIGLVFLQHYFAITFLLITCSAVAVIVHRFRAFAAAKKEFETYDQKFKRRIESNVRKVSLLIIALVMSVALCGGGVHYLKGNPVAMPSVAATNSVERTDGSLVKTHLNEIAKLKEDVWETLGTTEKLDVLQTVLNIETTFLAIEPLKITCEKLDDYTIGRYADGRNVIYINVNYLNSPEECIDTVCHEARHAYQYHVINSLDWDDEEVQNGFYFNDAREWRDNYNNYISGENDAEGYYTQSIEEDARNYASLALEEYQLYISFYYGTLEG